MGKPDGSPAAAKPNAAPRRVLLVEDDHDVRALARRLLQDAGHTVIEAQSGEEGLARWREATSTGKSVDVVVTDVVMPDMGGRELVAQLRAQRPGLPVVYMSSFLADAVAGLDLSGPAELLEKPFTPASFADAVDAVLGRGD
jgi:two-component system cell cycle sensor histidine kinase/response regulator CckA